VEIRIGERGEETPQGIARKVVGTPGRPAPPSRLRGPIPGGGRVTPRRYICRSAGE
jgi:hypothetical protein